MSGRWFTAGSLRCQPTAIATPLPLGWRWEVGAMTYVVNLLPWRDLRRRQRLRYALLLATGIVLLVGTTLQAGRTAGLQRDALARIHTTADAALLASLKQREQAMREAWQQHQRQREQRQRRSTIAAWQPRLMALAAGLPAQAWLTRLEYQGAPDAGWSGPQPAGAGSGGGCSGQRRGIRAG